MTEDRGTYTERTGSGRLTVEELSTLQTLLDRYLDQQPPPRTQTIEALQSDLAAAVGITR